MNAALHAVNTWLSWRPHHDFAILTPARRRAARHGLVLGGVLAAALAGWASYHGPAIDAYAYWVNRPPVSYSASPGTDGAFLYSPAFAQFISPLTAFSWQIFLAFWLVAMLGTLAWLAGPLLLFPAVLLFGNEIYFGNIHFFMAAAIVLGFRHPWAWASILLTKVTPGIGLLWFVARREWRSLVVALTATAMIILVSFVLDPTGWFGWLGLLSSGISGGGFATVVPGPLWFRILLASAIVVWAARSDRRWAVPLGAVVAVPHATLGITMLVAIIPLLDNPRLRPSWRNALA